MGPVSFERLGAGLDRPRLLAAARTLTAAGISVTAVDPEQGILVRSEDLIRAKALLDE